MHTYPHTDRRTPAHLAARVALLFGAVVLLTTVAYTAEAATISFDATGENTLTTEGFFGVSFDSGGGFIESLSLDVSEESQAFFDLDGRSNYQGAFQPMLYSLVGLGAGDVKITRSDSVGGNFDHPSVLTFSFLAQTFGTGDSFRFSVDTDYLADDPARGGALATTSLLLRIALEDGSVLTSNLSAASELQSVATVGAPVPEPGTAVFVATGLAIAAGVRRRRSA